MRFGPKQLEESVRGYNEAMAAEGVLKRFVVGGRNGYQAADEYTVDADGNRTGSGVDCNVGCGTSREVDRYCEIRHYQLRNAVSK